MDYLINKYKANKKSHLWNSSAKDTYCRMYSTGGLGNKNNLVVIKTLPPGKKVCNLCRNKYQLKHGWRPRRQRPPEKTLFD